MSRSEDKDTTERRSGIGRRREAADNGATSRSVKAFQLSNNFVNAKERKPSEEE